MLAAHLPNSAFAQDATAKRDSAVARLNTGQQIRLSGVAMHRLVGKAGVAANDSLDLAQDDAVRRISIPAIDTLWVRGNSWPTGAVVGGVVGGVLGSFAVLAVAGTCEYDCGSATVQAIGGALLGAAIGVPLGALIGGRFPKWKRRYP